MPHLTNNMTPWNIEVTLPKHSGPAYYRKQSLPILAAANCLVCLKMLPLKFEEKYLDSFENLIEVMDPCFRIHS